MIQFLALSTISDGHRDYAPGDAIELSDADASLLLEMGYIELAADDDGHATGELPPPVSSSAVARTNLNTATRDELVALPHVGRVSAQRLNDARPIGSLNDARAILKLSDERWAELQPRVTV
jgi:DNA uptake protein ComE-like DNA-binding protein